MNKKIEYHCPVCFYIPLYEIIKDKIKIRCPNNHQYEYNINDFLKFNPFQKTNIKCNHCSSPDNNIYNLLYCIKCKKYSCQKDIINFHIKCKKIILMEELYSTCLKHKSSLIVFCKTCRKEICNFCILKSHSNHVLSENISKLYDKLQFLFNNEYLEKIFIEKLLLLDYNNDKIKLIFRNSIIFYDFLKKLVINEFNNQRFSIILYINIFEANFALYEFKENLKPVSNNDVNKNQIIENDIFNNFLPSFRLYLEKEINNNLVLYTKKNNFFISLIDEDNSKVEIKNSINNKINNLIIQKDELNNEDIIPINIHPIKFHVSKPKDKDKLLNKFFNQKISDIIKKDNTPAKFAYLSYKSLMTDEYSKELYIEKMPKKRYYNKGKYILLQNNYFLILINNKINQHTILVLISPDNKYKTILDFGYNIMNLCIYLVYKNIFLISFSKPGKILFFEFFPKNQKIELISKITNDFEIFDCYEFDGKYCILVTNNGILFYFWKKNKIIRAINLAFEKSEYEQSILVNKYYLVGICINSIFVYNFFNDKLYEYPSNEGFFSFFKNNNYKYILKIYENYFITWNDTYYYIISVIPKGLVFINKGKINPNKCQNNLNEDNNNNYFNSNKTLSYNGSDSYSESYNESDDIDINNNQLFSGNDLKGVFGGNLFNNTNKSKNVNFNNEKKSLFENVNKQNEENKNKNENYSEKKLFIRDDEKKNIFNNTKNLFDDKNKSGKNIDNSNNKSERLFSNFNNSTGLFENIKNQNNLFGNLNNQNEGLFRNINNQNQGLFENMSNQNEGLFGNINNQNQGLFGNINNQNEGLFWNINNQKQGLFGNINSQKERKKNNLFENNN